MRFAWTFEGYIDHELKNDPRYVKTIVRTFGRDDGETTERIMDFHECTDEDLKYFAPPSNDAEQLLTKIREDPKRALFCIDWDEYGDELEIWGMD